MNGRLLALAGATLFFAACASPNASEHIDTADPRSYVVEQMPGGTVEIHDGVITIEDAAGCTVWLRPKLRTPVEIDYDVTAIARNGPHDRVSDVNCFWMATDSRAPEGCPFAPRHRRTGKFAEYDSLRTYYVGMGGNDNTTTRFRKYDGAGAKPLLPEHDLRARAFLLEPNRTYHLRVVAKGGIAEFWRDGVRIFSFSDPQPLTEGWFGFRTVQSHLEIRNVKVTTDPR